MLRDLRIEKGKTFKPDERQKKLQASMEASMRLNDTQKSEALRAHDRLRAALG